MKVAEPFTVIGATDVVEATQEGFTCDVERLF